MSAVNHGNSVWFPGGGQAGGDRPACPFCHVASSLRGCAKTSEGLPASLDVSGLSLPRAVPMRRPALLIIPPESSMRKVGKQLSLSPHAPTFSVAVSRDNTSITREAGSWLHGLPGDSPVAGRFPRGYLQSGDGAGDPRSAPPPLGLPPRGHRSSLWEECHVPFPPRRLPQ